MLIITSNYLLRGICHSLFAFPSSVALVVLFPKQGMLSLMDTARALLNCKLQLAPGHFGFFVPRYQYSRREAPGIRRRLHDYYTMEIGKIHLAPKLFI